MTPNSPNLSSGTRMNFGRIVEEEVELDDRDGIDTNNNDKRLIGGEEGQQIDFLISNNNIRNNSLLISGNNVIDNSTSGTSPIQIVQIGGESTASERIVFDFSDAPSPRLNIDNTTRLRKKSLTSPFTPPSASSDNGSDSGCNTLQSPNIDTTSRSISERLNLATPHIEENQLKSKKKMPLQRFDSFLRYLHRELNVTTRNSPNVISNSEGKSTNDVIMSAETPTSTQSTPICDNSQSSLNGKPYNFPNGFIKLSHDPKDNCFTDEELRGQLYKFIEIPIRVERFLFFGFFICLDTFLFYLTFFPVRVFLSLWRIIWSIVKYIILLPFRGCLREMSNGNSRLKPSVNESVLFDLVKFFCLVINIILIMQTTDYSLLYHYIRGESILKLYVIGNMLDVFDKLCSSFGLDSQIALLYSSKQFVNGILNDRSGSWKEFGHMTVMFIFHMIYLYVHSIVQLIRIVTLNAALNSSNYTLLTMIISTNFVELKGSVFKRFTKENLFQLASSDVVERFEIFWFTILIFVQNTLRTIVDSTSGPVEGVDLNDFETMTNLEGSSSLFSFLDDKLEEFGHIFIFMICAEILVDTLKHTFVSKFNSIHPSTFRMYTLKLCDDLISHSDSAKKSETTSVVVSSFFHNTNRSKVARRLGFLEGPLITHTLRMIMEVMLPWLFHFVAVLGYSNNWDSLETLIAIPSLSKVIYPIIITLLGFLCLFLLKLLISITIIGHAAKNLCAYKQDPNNVIPNFPDRYMMFDKRIP
ncbi:DUF747 domain-containing protein [Naegleria gruberi]|uniref:DUF747 domain-containing protein n=1 Tax=Naegleria gruberi TaxID=5762 RepID=D2V2R2_NAEGR|nr:DUF747 domain-containing protein [Naegleria gruberi]EFC49106.1 DUF747 domain-containing protein [Naegleria gruberi]|eukprot:XP_002681850.1 DUF747 domain-containing protein [Naegleria gruberi strain NEG-M]